MVPIICLLVSNGRRADSKDFENKTDWSPGRVETGEEEKNKREAIRVGAEPISGSNIHY